MFSRVSGASAGTYPDLDNFNRVTTSRWTKDLASDIDFYNVAIGYDRDSNITSTIDAVWPGRDLVYGIDNLGRVSSADEGTYSGGSITSRTRKEEWTLTQTGNWSNHKLDSNGDGAYTPIGDSEMDDTGTFNEANEWLTRDLDSNPGTGLNNRTLTWNDRGEMTYSGKGMRFEYDAFGRLRKIKDDSSNLKEEFTYNGLGYRIGWHYDVDADGTLENTSDDPWYYFAYDDNWRMIGTFRSSDTNAKELFVNHPIGHGMDGVILRDRDVNTAWQTAMDGTRENRIYYCQNWRGDVVSIVGSDGKLKETVRYSAYGVPFGIPLCDVDGDGAVAFADSDQVVDWDTFNVYDVRGDFDLDGDIDFDDTAIGASGTLGRGELSLIGNRKGYAGYEHDGVYNSACHVRNRVLLTEFGRWTRRDPLGYVDGMSLYQYAQSHAIARTDPSGLRPPYYDWDRGEGWGPQAPSHPPGMQYPFDPLQESTPSKDTRGPGGSPPEECLICPNPPCFLPFCGRQSIQGSACETLCGYPEHQDSGGASSGLPGSQYCCVCDNTLRDKKPHSWHLLEDCVETHEAIHLIFLGCPFVTEPVCQHCYIYTEDVRCLREKLMECETPECRSEIEEQLTGTLSAQAAECVLCSTHQ